MSPQANTRLASCAAGPDAVWRAWNADRLAPIAKSRPYHHPQDRP
ncbi:hypothetical protein [Streptomyces varsoviensis]|nr:hypothetical protein [Streptomyces varsoviensis]